MNNAFIGEPRVLQGGDHPEWGSLLVVVRNGEPVRVVAPGKRIWRGIRSPATGALKVVPVNQGTVSVKQVVRDIPTGDPHGFFVSAVPLELRVRLNPGNGYQGLATFIRGRGQSFADDLLGELRNGIDAHVRHIFRTRTHDELYGESLGQLLKSPGRPLVFLEGLMLIESLGVDGAISWSSAYLDMRRAGEQTIVGIAENQRDKVLGVGRINVEEEIKRVELTGMQQLALSTGLPLEFLIDPAGYVQSSRDNAMQLINQLLQPSNRALLHKNFNIFNQLMASTGIGQLPNNAMDESTAVTAIETLRQLEQTQPLELLKQPQDDYTADDPLDLTLDRRLQRIANATQFPPDGRIVGAATEMRDGQATIVVVVEGTSSRDAPQRFIDQCRGLLRAHHVSVIVLNGNDVATLSENFLAVVAREEVQVIDLRINVRDEQGLDYLVWTLHGDSRTCRAVQQSLNDPSSTARGAFESLLPFAGLDVEIAV